MTTYAVEWEETTRYRVAIEAPGPQEARECFWWVESDGTLHDAAVEIDGGGPQEVIVTADPNQLLLHFDYKRDYLEAQC